MSEVKKIKPQLSKGTRDFLPGEVAKRNYIFDTIKSVFRKYGFEEIETPAIERLETLTGKYGEEGDKLLFKILNSGDYLKDVPKEELAVGNSQLAIKYIAEKGLRYDLTVPLARYVVQHQDDLAFPFKRFHIGPVWRADRPQKGRYQEFYQCDADVIGSNSLLNEVELTKIYLEVFEKLGMDVTVQINNRKILWGIAKHFRVENRFQEFVTIMDKLDKIDYSGVAAELIRDNIKLMDGDSPIKEEKYQLELSKFRVNLDEEGNLISMLDSLRDNLGGNGGYGLDEIALKGLKEFQNVLQYFGTDKRLKVNPYLARGLNYYTGTIWEVVCNNVQMGSIASGGRYDNLTEMFGGQNMSGVGISFGIERIYDVMEELQLFPETIAQGVKVLFVPRDQSVEEFTFNQVQQLRQADIAAEIFLGNVKKQKQFTYAEQKNIGYLVEVGDNEKQSQKFRLRNAKTRDTQNDLTLSDIIQQLR